MKKDEYKVGYKKPPKEYQFAKGRSGNPKGSAKVEVNLAKILREQIKDKITISEDGKVSKISKFDGIIKKLVIAAASGNMTALKDILALIPQETGDEFIVINMTGKSGDRNG